MLLLLPTRRLNVAQQGGSVRREHRAPDPLPSLVLKDLPSRGAFTGISLALQPLSRGYSMPGSCPLAAGQKPAKFIQIFPLELWQFGLSWREGAVYQNQQVRTNSA